MRSRSPGRRLRTTWLAACMACATAMVDVIAGVGAPQGPTFRTSVDLVTVGVSVRRNGRPVRGLDVGDFTLLDNGIAQPIVALSYETLPIDLSVVLDVSGSVTGPVIAQLRRAVDDVRRSLRQQDRLRVITFNTAIQRVVDFGDPSTAIAAAFSDLRPGGGSAVFDALALALASGSQPDRRHLVILFSDGRDGSSIGTPDTLLAVARATTPTVFVVLATPARLPSDRVYADLAAQTGGRVVSLLPTESLGNSLRSALEQSRSTYVLTYAPTGVERTGDHALEVRVNQPGLEVRARRGYAIGH